MTKEAEMAERVRIKLDWLPPGPCTVTVELPNEAKAT